jgi:hypothetical protein
VIIDHSISIAVIIDHSISITVIIDHSIRIAVIIDHSISIAVIIDHSSQKCCEADICLVFTNKYKNVMFILEANTTHLKITYESVSIYGQQFHQYQQNVQSSLTIIQSV